jgi:hypothetical protein
MTPEELKAALTSSLRVDLHLATLEDADAIELVLSYEETTICRAKVALPEPVAAVPPAPCPHPHSSADDVRTALLGIVAELRRAAKICESTGQHYRADAFYDAAAYIEDGKWPTTYGLPVAP